MTEVIIPPAALEGAKKIIEVELPALHLTPDEYTALIHAACLAMLKAWPGMHIGAPWVIGIPNAPSVILPLTEKPSHE